MTNDKRRPSKHRFNLALDFTYDLCVEIGTPRALTVYLLLKAGEWEQYLALKCDVQNYLDPLHFALDYQATSVLQKSAGMPTKIDKKAVALASFKSSEESCRSTNRLISRWRNTHENAGLFQSVARQISRILGPLRGRQLSEINNLMRFGPGANTAVKGVGSTLSNKFDASVHLTHSLLPFQKAIRGPLWHEAISSGEIVAGSKFACVPKNAKTHRGIAVEPSLNIFYQLGIGTYLKRRLRFHGCDLREGQVWNQTLAELAVEWDLATIDLKAASDTIAKSLVHELLPEPWIHLLDLGRSPMMKVEGEWIELEKYSSMGNGYTFELESLIFWALVTTIVPSTEHCFCAVYGDDIILPRRYAKQLITALNIFGFSVNAEKSFLAGSFFESCGSDWFLGNPVRPFYLDRDPEEDSERGIPFQLQACNAFRLWVERIYGYPEKRFQALWDKLRKSVPPEWRTYGGSELGDTVIYTSPGELTPIRRPKHHLEGYIVNTLRLQSIYTSETSEARPGSLGLLLAMLTAINGTERRDTHGREPKRGLFGKLIRKATVVKWLHLGPWV